MKGRKALYKLFFHSSFMFEVINIDFWQIFHFKIIKVAGQGFPESIRRFFIWEIFLSGGGNLKA